MEITTVDGKAFADFLVSGTYFLRKYRSVVNDLNVFPVPDGDTGTNMLLTIRSAMIEARKVRNEPLSAVSARAAEGSLMGARGNSGVIISQMLRGFAHAVRHRERIATIDLASGMQEAVDAARRALVKPVEGTMLSVASAAARAAFAKATRDTNFYSVLHSVVAAANDALEKTPEQLAILKEANVVDAGGQGFVYFMEGAIRMLPGRAPYKTAFPRKPIRKTTFTAKQKVETHRFCTEFVLVAARTSADELRSALLSHGDSIIVAGGDGTLHVHIHTDYPRKIADFAAERGTVTKLKIDNMEEQHNVLVVDREAKPRGIVSVAPGEGFAKICKELGTDVVVLGGPTMNPSVRDLVVAIDKVLAPVVYVLANDKNIVLAANQASTLTDHRVIVVPTKTIAEGIAALFALLNRPDDVEVAPDDILGQASNIASGSIFRSARDVTIGGVTAKRNQLIGVVDAQGSRPERLVEGKDAAALAVAIVRAADAQAASLITVFYGTARKLKEAEAVSASLRTAFPTATVESYYGGQPSSDYIISIEK
jgi:uncharacterized protein